MSYGCESDPDGETISIFMEGPVGEGRISGIHPSAAMDFAIMLARQARQRAVAWPTPYADDPWSKAVIDGLQVQLEERSPDQDDEHEEREYARAQLSERMELLRHQSKELQETVFELDNAVSVIIGEDPE